MRVVLWFRDNLRYWLSTRTRAIQFGSVCLIAYGLGLLVAKIYLTPSGALIFQVHSWEEFRMILEVVYHLRW